MKRYSKQRECIKTVLRNTDKHPTADMLYTEVKKILPNIGIATVYRNLAELTDSGEIIKIKTKNGGPDRYDGNIKPHIHFECQKCHSVYDIFPKNKIYEQLNDNIEKMTNLIEAEAKESDILIYGICKRCREENENESLCM